MLHRAPGVRQRHQHPPLVFGRVSSRQQRQGFETLEQRCQRIGVKRQALAELPDRDAVLTPERQYDEILRVIGIGPRSEGGFDITFPGMSETDAGSLVEATHGICQYSNAITASVDVKTTTHG